MRYKVGDKVRVKSLVDLKKNYLYDEEEDVVYEKEKYSGCRFVRPMQKYCGEVIIIDLVEGEGYYNSKIGYHFEDWMLEDIAKETPIVNLSKEWTGSHYDFYYNLTEEDIKNGKIKLDPYFVGKQWKIGSKDDSGILVHQLKTIARFGSKNDIKREVKALYEQAKRMMEIYEVDNG